MTVYASRLDTPIGPMTALVDEGGALTHLLFAHHAPPPGAVWDDDRCAAVRAQLEEYFRGERDAFALALAPAGSDFQRRVWSELARIPFGATVSYAELAARAGRPGAARAAGRANATNPIPIVLPCHRVLGANGSLTGYAGGLETKRRLLELEGATLPL